MHQRGMMHSRFLLLRPHPGCIMGKREPQNKGTENPSHTHTHTSGQGNRRKKTKKKTEGIFTAPATDACCAIQLFLCVCVFFLFHFFGVAAYSPFFFCWCTVLPVAFSLHAAFRPCTALLGSNRPAARARPNEAQTFGSGNPKIERTRSSESGGGGNGKGRAALQIAAPNCISASVHAPHIIHACGGGERFMLLRFSSSFLSFAAKTKAEEARILSSTFKLTNKATVTRWKWY